VVEGFITDFKRFFLRGLAAMLPTLLTLMIVIYVFSFIQKYLGGYIETSVQWLVVRYRVLFYGATAAGMPTHWEIVQGWWKAYHLGWIGFLLAFVVIYVFGRFLTSFVGRSIWQLAERALGRTPVLRQVYPLVKQVTDFLLVQRKMAFSGVVAVEYPRKGIWSLGLVTGPGMKTLQKTLEADLLTVFVPSSPTPVTGYTITVRRDEVIDLPISIDDALRFTVSAGLVRPAMEVLPGEEDRVALEAAPRKEKRRTEREHYDQR
jgi:uncharacterized membrane protein